jgi:hypothetical protein
VIATRAIVADAAPLLALISDSASQWRIVENVSPLLQPSANVQPSRAPGPVYVRVRFGSRDVLWITWILTARRGTTEVDLAAQVESRSIFARLLLAFGGRLWLRRRLEQTLSTLAMLAIVQPRTLTTSSATQTCRHDRWRHPPTTRERH